jgi:hypothetical protein
MVRKLLEKLLQKVVRELEAEHKISPSGLFGLFEIVIGRQKLTNFIPTADWCIDLSGAFPFMELFLAAALLLVIKQKTNF